MIKNLTQTYVRVILKVQELDIGGIVKLLKISINVSKNAQRYLKSKVFVCANVKAVENVEK